MNKLRALFAKYRELIVYVVFGALTTLVNFVVFQILEFFLQPRWGDHSYMFSKIVAFILALAFAFIVNKLYVFHSKSWERRLLVHELLTFSAARVVSFVLVEFIVMVVAFEVIWPRVEPRFAPWWLRVWPEGWPAITPRGAFRFLALWCVIQVIVVVMNYVFSKWVVFKKKKEKKG